MKDDYAIVVGINEYPGLSPLKGAEFDAKAFRDWLVSPGGGAVPAKNVRPLLTSAYHKPSRKPVSVANAKPTVQIFMDALRAILLDSQGVPRPKVGRRLYLYFSGHGFMGNSTTEEAALYAANTTPAFPEHIAGTRITNLAINAAPFDEIMLVMDCCRDTSLLGQIMDPVLKLTPNPQAAANVRAVYAYATQRGSQAKERKIHGKGPVRGPFTYALLEGFQRAAADPQGVVTGQAVKNYVLNLWPNISDSPDPVILVDHPKKDIAVLVRPVVPAAQSPTEVRFRLDPPAPGGSISIEDGDLQPVMAIALTNGSVRQRLPHGYYTARLVGTGRGKTFHAIGDSIDVRF